MTHADKITCFLDLYKQQLAYPSSSTNLVLERSLYSFLYKHQSDLPAIDDSPHYKARFHMAFREGEVTMDKMIDTIMFCMLSRSTIVWDALEQVVQHAGHKYVLTHPGEAATVGVVALNAYHPGGHRIVH